MPRYLYITKKMTLAFEPFELTPCFHRDSKLTGQWMHPDGPSGTLDFERKKQSRRAVALKFCFTNYNCSLPFPFSSTGRQLRLTVFSPYSPFRAEFAFWGRMKSPLASLFCLQREIRASCCLFWRNAEPPNPQPGLCGSGEM